MIISQFCDNSGRNITQYAKFCKKIEKGIAINGFFQYNKFIYSMWPQISVYCLRGETAAFR